MGMVDAKCPICGADIMVDDTKDAAICEACSAPFIVKKAILARQESAKILNATINVQNINIIANDADFIIEAGVLKKYRGASTVVYVPDSVKEVENDAFPYSVTEVYFPNSVRKIKKFAFGRRLATTAEKKKYPDYFEFDDLEGCGVSALEKVVLPSAMKHITEKLFYNMVYLREVVIPEGIDIIGAACFENCDNLVIDRLPEGVKKIEADAFNGCKQIKSIQLPSTLKSISGRAFSSSQITEIELPSKVTELMNAFCDMHDLKEVKLPESVTELYCTFQNCKGLENVRIPRSVVDIGERSFLNCEKLTHIFIPEEVETVARNAFWGCRNLVVYVERKKPFLSSTPKGWMSGWNRDCKKVIWQATEEDYEDSI